jgi:MYXO-CTERM domain-containing protein
MPNTYFTFRDAQNDFTGFYGSVASVSVSATPLPDSLPLFATGLAALGLLGWRRRRVAAV